MRHNAILSEPKCDVLIVGGGPAGSLSALLLARAGWQVDLLERRTFPRAKACGDCLSPAANDVLARQQLWSTVLAQRPAQLTGWQVTAGQGAGFNASFQRADGTSCTGLALPRARLDHALLSAAAAAGVRVHTSMRVTDLTFDRDGFVNGVRALNAQNLPVRFPARLVIGADGLRSIVARRLGAIRRTPKLRKLSLTARVRSVPGLGTLGELHLTRGACLGIAPVEADAADPLCNVTVVLSESVPAHGKRELLLDALARFPRRDLRAFIPEDTEIWASGPFDWPCTRVTFDGAVLVGDAAGYYDPFTGQGIYQALAGAELLASAAGQALRGTRCNSSSLRGYAEAHRRLSCPTRRLQHAIEFVCARPSRAAHAIRFLARAPAAARAVIAATGDLLPPHALLSPRLLASLLTDDHGRRAPRACSD